MSLILNLNPIYYNGGTDVTTEAPSFLILNTTIKSRLRSIWDLQLSNQTFPHKIKMEKCCGHSGAFFISSTSLLQLTRTI